MLCAPSIHCCICCLVRARLYQSIDRLAWSSLISSSRMVRSRKRWLALSLKNPMCGETTGGKGFHLQVCVCVWIGFSSDIRCVWPRCLCVCDVCVLVSLHLGMFASVHFVNVVQGCAGKQSTIITINEMMKCACSFNFLHKCRAWLGLIAWHFSAPRYQGLITLLPSRLIWGVQILSSTVLHSPTRSYYVCWKHSDDSFQDTVSNELGKQQANLGVDLHEFQTSASVPRRYLSGVWNMTKMDEPCCVGQALHFKAVCQSRSAMHQQTNFPAEHHHFSRRIKSNDQTSNTLNWLSWLSPFSQSPMACATGACGAITTYPLYVSQILTVSHD